MLRQQRRDCRNWMVISNDFYLKFGGERTEFSLTIWGSAPKPSPAFLLSMEVSPFVLLCFVFFSTNHNHFWIARIWLELAWESGDCLCNYIKEFLNHVFALSLLPRSFCQPFAPLWHLFLIRPCLACCACPGDISTDRGCQCGYPPGEHIKTIIRPEK